VTTLARLNGIRRKIPYGYWLVYDAVIGGLLVYGLSVSPAFAVGVPFFAASVIFDVVEWVVKRDR
jgi:hypothetical protein